VKFQTDSTGARGCAVLIEAPVVPCRRPARARYAGREMRPAYAVPAPALPVVLLHVADPYFADWTAPRVRPSGAASSADPSHRLSERSTNVLPGWPEL
jgi:hypothetical protein